MEWDSFILKTGNQVEV